MSTKQHFFSALLLMTSVSCLAAGTTLGQTNAQRCFEESRYVLSMQGINYCADAIRQDELSKRDLAATYSNRGIIYAANGKYERALSDHSQAIKLKPDLGQAYINRANAYFHTLNYKKALADYNLAIEAGGSKIHIAYFNRGLTFAKMKRIDEALQSLGIALEFTPGSRRIKLTIESLEEVKNENNI